MYIIVYNTDTVVSEYISNIIQNYLEVRIVLNMMLGIENIMLSCL